MTVFLLEYEPAKERLVSFTALPETERAQAQAERLRREKANAAAGIDREVVLLEALDEATVRSTHSRYFHTLEELAAAPKVA